jgi:sporulation protein YlmC with PRC-barrel domain
MKLKLSTMLIAGAIVAMSATPLWAASDAAKTDTAAPNKTELGVPTPDEEKMMGRTSEPIYDPESNESNYPMGDSALYALSADKLEDMKVVDRSGETVGTIKSVVLAPDRRSANAVISTGGFLGMATRDILVSIRDLRQVEEDVLQMSATREQIDGLHEYSANPYVELKGDDPIGVSFVAFSAFEAGKDLPRSQAQAQTPRESTTGQSARAQDATAGSATAQRAVTTAQTRSSTTGTAVGDNPLYTRSAASLNGMEVIDSAGKSFGKVKQVVLAPTRDSASVVISVGGLLGMGARDILLALDDLTLVDDKLQLSATKEQIDALKDYSPEQYVEIKGGTPISGSIVEFSALEVDSGAAAPKKPKAAY